MIEKKLKTWTVPYLPIDPKDVGREYESDVIRINSQSGKGGVAFVLKQNFGMSLPDKMKEEVGYLIKGVSDHRHEELTPDMIYKVFTGNYVNIKELFDLPDSLYQSLDLIRRGFRVKYSKRHGVIPFHRNNFDQRMNTFPAFERKKNLILILTPVKRFHIIQSKIYDVDFRMIPDHIIS